MFNRKSQWALLIIALAIISGLVLSSLWTSPAPMARAQLEWLDTPRALVPFTLSSDEQPFTRVSMQGHWQLLVLGFTHCPDVCPLSLTQLVDLRAAYAGTDLRLIFVSVDPRRDSPQQVATYVDFFGEDIVAVTGTEGELHKLAESLGMGFRISGSAEKIEISHSPTIVLIGPAGFMRGRLRPGFEPQQAAQELLQRIGSAS